MQKKIIYWVQDFRPKDEAISKEIDILHKNFNSIIINPVNGFKFSKNLISFNFRRFPFGLFCIPFFDKKNKISHIYTSLGNYFFLRLLRTKPVILTAAGPSPKHKIKKCLKFYKKLNKIIVESEYEKKLLLSLNVQKNKIELIYPGIDLNKFNYNKAEGRFKILFASAPLEKKQFYTKGVLKILEVAKNKKDVDFILLWRGKFLKDILKLTKDLDNVHIINNKIKDMNQIYGKVHATILPIINSKNSKPCPHSIIESLASGKPVLVSNMCKISNLIKKEKCGIVFESTTENIIQNITKLKENYEIYQKKCNNVAKKYFDKKDFLSKYKKIYSEIKD